VCVGCDRGEFYNISVLYKQDMCSVTVVPVCYVFKSLLGFPTQGMCNNNYNSHINPLTVNSEETHCLSMVSAVLTLNIFVFSFSFLHSDLNLLMLCPLWKF